MVLLSDNTHITAQVPPSPTLRRARSSTAGIGKIWSELAALTVRAFTPAIIAQLQELAHSNDDFDPKAHLPLLGSIVVRHTRLALDDPSKENTAACARRAANTRALDVAALQCPAEAPPPLSSMSTSTLRLSHVCSADDCHRCASRRRSSYRDLAYHAVRLRKIIPANVPDSSEPVADARTAPPSEKRGRRVSIRLSQNVTATALRKGKSAHLLCASTARHSLQPTTAVGGAQHVEEQLTKRIHTGLFRKETPLTPFPRASAAANIRPKSLQGSQDPVGDEVTSAIAMAKESAPATRTPLGRRQQKSRLVQMRKQRTEKRKKQVG